MARVSRRWPFSSPITIALVPVAETLAQTWSVADVPDDYAPPQTTLSDQTNENGMLLLNWRQGQSHYLLIKEGSNK